MGYFRHPCCHTRQSMRHSDQTRIISRWPGGIWERGFAFWPSGVNYSQACVSHACRCLVQNAVNGLGPMGKAAVRLGTTEDEDAIQNIEDGLDWVKGPQQRWRGGKLDLATIFFGYSHWCGTYGKISLVLFNNSGAGEPHYRWHSTQQKFILLSFKKPVCACMCVYIQAVPGCSTRVVWCAAAEVWQWAGWRQESARSSSGTVTLGQRCTDPVWLLTWPPPDASHPCGGKEVENWFDIRGKNQREVMEVGEERVKL